MTFTKKNRNMQKKGQTTKKLQPKQITFFPKLVKVKPVGRHLYFCSDDKCCEINCSRTCAYLSTTNAVMVLLLCMSGCCVSFLKAKLFYIG